MENPPRPRCCPEVEKEGGIWWEPEGLEGHYAAGAGHLANLAVKASIAKEGTRLADAA